MHRMLAADTIQEHFMQTHARVVIVGGGIMGVGLLYHLALEGWTDAVLIEKGELTSGSTWHAAGQCPQISGSLNLTKVHVYGNQLYPKLEELTGQAVSWHGCGGLRLATTEEEVSWMKRIYGLSRLGGYECELIGPEEIPKYHPFLATFGVKAALRTINDGHVAPADVTNAMAAGARKLGAKIERRTRVTNITLLPSGEWQVETDKGNVICEHVVNSAGSYCDVVGAWTGHNVPIANMLHHYVISEPVPELIALAPELPVVRDPWSHSYLREEGNGILIGPYETDTAHVCWDGAAPTWDFENELVAPELERIAPWLERAAERFPLFANAGIKSVISGAITHTPDGTYLSGPAPGPKNYWMHCGASIGICQGGGAGKYLAQWMVHGQAEINMREFDPRRFGNWADKAYTTEVSIEDYHHMYYCYKPGEQHAVGRNLRQSALHDTLAAEGAQFAQIYGWERPRWYDKSGKGEDYSFRRSNWFEPVRAEALAVRERVGLMDISTFSKFEVTGPDAHAYLDRICANKIPVRDGAIVLTHLLNDNGFIEAELTITRLSAEHFYLASAATAQIHDLDQLRWRQLATERVTIRDVTDDYGVLVLAGPRARDVLAHCTSEDLTNAAFPWLTGRLGAVAGVDGIRLLRINYVGELGWELHVPRAGMAAVFAALRAAGKPHGLQLFGTYAMNALRIEKAYRGFGSELTAEIDMFEASMERFIRLDKPDFIGKAASLKRKQHGKRMQLVYLELDATDADAQGNEPVFAGDTVIGVTTSGGYGYTVGKSLAFAYVPPEHAAIGTAISVMLYGDRHAARIIANPIFDPTSARCRA
jgi:dimethylglycine dehydrogenase